MIATHMVDVSDHEPFRAIVDVDSAILGRQF